MGLDVGDRRIGVALSDPLGLTAQPLTVLERRRPAADAAAVQALIEAHGAELVVIGLPLTMAGAHGVQADKVLAFTEQLRHGLSVPVRFVDERLTTVQGERVLREAGVRGRRRKQTIDRVAAQLILQQFLDSRREPTAEAGS